MMKKSTKVALLILGLLFIYLMYYQFFKKPEKISFTGETQGTYYAVTYFDKKSRILQDEVEALLKQFDRSASSWLEESIISRVNRNDATVVPDEIFKVLFLQSKMVYEQTQGAFDPTVGSLVNAWGFGYTEGIELDSLKIDSLLSFMGFNKVELDKEGIHKADERIKFDFNAIAQGYAVDLIGSYLERSEISDYLIDIGGEVLSSGTKLNHEKWKVGIELPSDNASYGENLSAKVELTDRALATSGNYRKFYVKDGVKYSHTINPANGYPVQHSLLSVSVMADQCSLADAYATAFMVMGVNKSIKFLESHPELDAFFIYSSEDENELKYHYTKGFEKILVQ